MQPVSVKCHGSGNIGTYYNSHNDTVNCPVCGQNTPYVYQQISALVVKIVSDHYYNSYRSL